MTSPDLRTVRVVVRGRVHGVGFRAFTHDEAARHGLRGWVRNRRDGTVEAVLAGAAVAVEATLAALRRGPPVARVDAVEVGDASAESIGLGFSVRDTV